MTTITTLPITITTRPSITGRARRPAERHAECSTPARRLGGPHRSPHQASPLSCSPPLPPCPFDLFLIPPPRRPPRYPFLCPRRPLSEAGILQRPYMVQRQTPAAALVGNLLSWAATDRCPRAPSLVRAEYVNAVSCFHFIIFSSKNQSANVGERGVENDRESEIRV